MLQGGHFLSDVLFAGWFMWVVTALVREAWLWVVRWRRGRRRVRGVRPEAEQAAALAAPMEVMDMDVDSGLVDTIESRD
jgi:hypothetical protein